MMQVLFQNLIVTAGKPGSALGTGIGYLIPTVIGIVFFLKSKETLQFQKPIVDFRVLWESGSNGFSEMVSQIATAVTTFVFISVALLILPQYFDVIGVWIAVPLAELLTIFVSLAFIWKNKKVYHYL